MIVFPPLVLVRILYFVLEVGTKNGKMRDWMKNIKLSDLLPKHVQTLRKKQIITDAEPPVELVIELPHSEVQLIKANANESERRKLLLEAIKRELGIT